MAMEIYTAAVEKITEAAAKNQPLHIVGGGSKAFYAATCLGQDGTAPEVLDVTSHQGIVAYQPDELVLSVRSGTRLAEVQALLDAEQQMLAFEPPHFGGDATIGGMVAAGISGSRRPYGGAVRDYVLGVNMIDGMGQSMAFGGQVMKNVAGYDVSRLMAGSLGCLGVITEVSFKVLPKPEFETSLSLVLTLADARKTMLAQLRQPLVSASAYFNGALYIRLSGAESSVRQCAKTLGGECAANAIWSAIDNLTLLTGYKDLWRISTRAASDLYLREASLIDWGGGQRWLIDPGFDPGLDPSLDPSLGAASAGHATLVRRQGHKEDGVPGPGDKFQRLTPVLLKIHQGLKHQFDPKGILNPHKMCAEF